MTRQRLDDYLASRQLVVSRHRAADLVRRQLVKVNGQLGQKPGQMVDPATVRVKIIKQDDYVSRGGDKLAGVAQAWQINFRDQVVADLGCGVGGFSDYALQSGARRVLATDVGREPLAAKIRNNPRVQWLSQTDARQLIWPAGWPAPDWILIDLAFISLRQVLPDLTELGKPETDWLVLVKPQFESSGTDLHHGVVKNSRLRRGIIVGFESWLIERGWQILAKRDSCLPGAKGNLERFYRLRKP